MGHEAMAAAAGAPVPAGKEIPHVPEEESGHN